MNVDNVIRIDLLNLYDRLKRYTQIKLRRKDRPSPETLITDDDYELVNPLIRLAMAMLATDVGAIKLAEDESMKALDGIGLRDGRLMLLGSYDVEESGSGSSETVQPSQMDCHVQYNLPGEQPPSELVPGFSELMLEAMAQYVLYKWYHDIGAFDLAQSHLREYDGLVRSKIRTHGVFFHPAKTHVRRPVNL